MIESIRRLASGCALALAAFAIQAEPVIVGVGSDITSIDPHYHYYTPNMNIADHIFGRLIERSELGRLLPGLALSWRSVDELTWEFKLRPKVVFHDGSPFTADDVVFSIDRVGQIKDSPGPLTLYTKEIASMSVVDPLTVRIKTAKPYPLLPVDLAGVPLVSKKVATGATTADFNSGKAAIGTGPYKLVRFAKGDRVELVASDTYWGKKPQAEALTFKIFTNGATRVAALLSGDVQVIDSVPAADMPRLTHQAELSVIQRASARIIYIALDQSRDQTPDITDVDGKPMSKNPLKDVRVRQAISKAIDRELIRTRIMEGASRPTGQLVTPGLPGYADSLKPDTPDVSEAKKLLADAGYPKGFNLVLHGTNNRYVQDGPILQALAQMFSRIGIATKVEALPSAVFFPRNAKSEFSAALSGWGTDTLDASSPLRAIIATRNKEKGFGSSNAGNYSNPKVDELIEKALATANDAQREKLMQSATELAMKDYGIIPIHHQVNVWAAKKGIRFSGRPDERTYGFEFMFQN